MRNAIVDRTGATVSRTGFAIRATLARVDGKVVFGATTLAYLLGYLLAVGHLLPGPGTAGVAVADQALSRFLRPALGPFSFEPVVRVDLWAVSYLFSFNSVLGAGLALLVGTNLAVSYLAWRQPSACGIGRSSAGLFAGIPALLSGFACCGPLVLIVVGVQATGAILTGFQFLLPAAALLLVLTLLAVGRKVDPAVVEADAR